MVTRKSTPKTAPAATPEKPEPNSYQIKAEEWGFTKGDTDSQVMAALSTRSALTATTYKAFAGGGDALEVTDLMGELRKAGEEVASGNMSRVEKMLAHQALTLDAIFNNMAQRSHKQETFKGIEVLMRLALKAQAQARSTAEALALLKNPMPYQTGQHDHRAATGQQWLCRCISAYHGHQKTHHHRTDTRPRHAHTHGRNLHGGTAPPPGVKVLLGVSVMRVLRGAREH